MCWLLLSPSSEESWKIKETKIVRKKQKVIFEEIDLAPTANNDNENNDVKTNVQTTKNKNVCT